MVERNAPCPCGSGKKYKKCCARKEETPLTQLVKEEIDRICIKYSEEIFTQMHLMNAAENLNRRWQTRLKGLIDEDEVEELVIAHYLYVVQREQWHRYIMKTINEAIRSQTRTVLTQWNQPIVLIGKVIGDQGKYYEVEEVLGHQTFCIPKVDLNHVTKNDLLIGIVLPDKREIDNGVYCLSGIIGVRDGSGKLTKKIEQLAASSQTKNGIEFAEKHMIDVYRIIFDNEVASVQEFADNELTPKQQGVLDVFTRKLEEIVGFRQQLENGQMIMISYLLKENPTFRKPEIIAAAVFKAMDNYGMLDEYIFYSQKEIAEMFGVSVSSMAKHIEPIEEIIETIIDEMIEDPLFNEEVSFAYQVGTDPRITERVNWEIYWKVEESETQSVEDLEALINQTANERFIPKGKKQKAQAYAYEAYEQEEYEARVRLAQVAYATDPDNIDAILLKAERAETVEEATQCYKRAIALGKLSYDEEESDEPWNVVINRPYMRALFSYGILLFVNENFDEALSYFQQLLKMNPNDNQCARHPAIAAAIHDGQFSLARQLMKQFPETSADGAVYRFLQWKLEIAEVDDSGLLATALDLNHHVLPFMQDMEISDMPYPKDVGIGPGSIEEALYIACLLGQT